MAIAWWLVLPALHYRLVFLKYPFHHVDLLVTMCQKAFWTPHCLENKDSSLLWNWGPLSSDYRELDSPFYWEVHFNQTDLFCSPNTQCTVCLPQISPCRSLHHTLLLNHYPSSERIQFPCGILPSEKMVELLSCFELLVTRTVLSLGLVADSADRILVGCHSLLPEDLFPTRDPEAWVWWRWRFLDGWTLASALRNDLVPSLMKIWRKRQLLVFTWAFMNESRQARSITV